MKKKLSLLILLICTLVASPLLPAEEETQSIDIDFTAGLNLSYNTVNIKMGEDNIENSMAYHFAALELEAEILSRLKLAVLAGYTMDSYKNPIEFTGLPLSLRLNKKWNNAMIFGLNVKSDFVSFGYFSLLAKGEFLFFKFFKNDKPIELPVVTGNAAIKNSFYQLTVDLCLMYEGLSGVTLFLGPQLNLLNGKLSIAETIEDIKADQTMEYKQKNLMGLACGMNIDVGGNWELYVKAGLFSKTSLTAGIFYLF